jgi:hypothetical protein
MSLQPEQLRRFARHIALPELGPEGQERLLRAKVAVIAARADDLAAATARDYLRGAGVTVDAETTRPRDAASWLDRLDGVALCVRAGFEDDPGVRAAVRLGVPFVAMRSDDLRVEILSLRQHGPCPHQDLNVTTSLPAEPSHGQGAVVAGTLAAAEALWLLGARESAADDAGAPRARHLRVPLDGGQVLAQEIPWRPECFLCGGQQTEAVFA